MSVPKEKLVDVQSRADGRRIPIDKVGIKGVRYPIVVKDRARGEQHTVGEFNMYVDLPHRIKGTHMSRFIEVLERHRLKVSLRTFKDICHEMREILHADVAHLEIAFPYFVSKKAPVSAAEGLMSYRCRIEGKLENGTLDMIVGVTVPVQTLCPCSKELAEVSAHTQRGEVRVDFRFQGFVWIEDVIELVESCASSPVYSLLHRDDEEHLTERAFAHPAFVEDVVREVARKMGDHSAVTWFRVDVENFESIHNHSAYACIERDQRGGMKDKG
ncbi:MAG: GTP cyclohydrolase FolE2 [Deltaproteobacteria bacterium]|nr:GTP cyclohydrolase FolE2 [Deltaproteobacteria bacterium]